MNDIDTDLLEKPSQMELTGKFMAHNVPQSAQAPKLDGSTVFRMNLRTAWFVGGIIVAATIWCTNMYYGQIAMREDQMEMRRALAKTSDRVEQIHHDVDKINGYFEAMRPVSKVELVK